MICHINFITWIPQYKTIFMAMIDQPLIYVSLIKISNTYRYRLAIKCKNSKSVRNLLMQVLKATVKMKELRKVQISIDLNPIDLG